MLSGLFGKGKPPPSFTVPYDYIASIFRLTGDCSHYNKDDSYDAMLCRRLDIWPPGNPDKRWGGLYRADPNARVFEVPVIRTHVVISPYSVGGASIPYEDVMEVNSSPEVFYTAYEDRRGQKWLATGIKRGFYWRPKESDEQLAFAMLGVWDGDENFEIRKILAPIMSHTDIRSEGFLEEGRVAKHLAYAHLALDSFFAREEINLEQLYARLYLINGARVPSPWLDNGEGARKLVREGATKEQAPGGTAPT